MRKLTWFLIIIAALASCKKDKDKEEVPLRPGRLTGIITPTGACATVTAKNVQTNASYSGVIDPSGNNFYIGDLPPGSYSVSFVAAANYLAPGNISATVSENTSSDIGTVTFQSTLPGISGTLGATGISLRVMAGGFGLGVHEADSDPTTGFFKITGLAPGQYTVNFPALNSTYKTPAPKDVTITNQNIDLGFIEYPKHVISFKYNGTAFPALNPVSVAWSSPAFSAEAYTGDPTNGSFKRLTIVLDNVTGPGTYTCQGTATSNITYSSKPHTSILTSFWNVSGTGGSGTVTITSIDPVKKKIKGSFSATLILYQGPATGNMVITDGDFEMVYP
jgi:hypothetical protein